MTTRNLCRGEVTSFANQRDIAGMGTRLFPIFTIDDVTTREDEIPLFASKHQNAAAESHIEQVFAWEEVPLRTSRDNEYCVLETTRQLFRRSIRWLLDVWKYRDVVK
jgi:hypothetical protein